MTTSSSLPLERVPSSILCLLGGGNIQNPSLPFIGTLNGRRGDVERASIRNTKARRIVGASGGSCPWRAEASSISNINVAIHQSPEALGSPKKLRGFGQKSVSSSRRNGAGAVKCSIGTFLKFSGRLRCGGRIHPPLLLFPPLTISESYQSSSDISGSIKIVKGEQGHSTLCARWAALRQKSHCHQQPSEKLPGRHANNQNNTHF